MAPRVWLITGTSSGFGLELAKIAAANGERVLAATRNPDKIAHLKGITAVRLDHNEPLPKVQKAVESAIGVYGTIDIVVNNAAYVQTGIIEESTPEQTEQQFVSNVFGPINLYRAILPHFRSKRSGTLVTIGSMAAWYPMPGCNLYNASKAALRWLGIGLAGEVKHLGISHMLVEPGFFRTSLLDPKGNFEKTDVSARNSDYEELNKTNDGNFETFNGAQLGDPKKGAQIIFDTVTSSGLAKGRELPEFLPLGSDAISEISKAAEQTLKDIEAWKDIAVQSDIKE